MIATKPAGTNKTHCINETEMAVPEDANSIANKGEPSSTTGLLGRGKLIPPNTTGSPDILIGGSTEAVGIRTESTKDKESVVPCNKKSGPAP